MPSAEAPVEDRAARRACRRSSSTPPTAFGTTCDEEVGHRRDVAVDALDQLARRVRPVELVVEAEHVAGHAQAQLVRGAPRGDRRVAGDDDADRLRWRRRWRGRRRARPTNVAVRRAVGRPGRRCAARPAARRAPAPSRPPGARRGRPNAERRAAGGRRGRARAKPKAWAPGHTLRSERTGLRGFHAQRPAADGGPRAGPGTTVARVRGRVTLPAWSRTPPPSRHRSRPTSSSRRSCWSRRSRSTACAASTDVARHLLLDRRWRSIRRSRCGPSRSARSPTTTATAGWSSSSTPTSSRVVRGARRPRRRVGRRAAARAASPSRAGRRSSTALDVVDVDSEMRRVSAAVAG